METLRKVHNELFEKNVELSASLVKTKLAEKKLIKTAKLMRNTSSDNTSNNSNGNGSSGDDRKRETKTAMEKLRKVHNELLEKMLNYLRHLLKPKLAEKKLIKTAKLMRSVDDSVGDSSGYGSSGDGSSGDDRKRETKAAVEKLTQVHNELLKKMLNYLRHLLKQN